MVLAIGSLRLMTGPEFWSQTIFDLIHIDAPFFVPKILADLPLNYHFLVFSSLSLGYNILQRYFSSHFVLISVPSMWLMLAEKPTNQFSRHSSGWLLSSPCQELLGSFYPITRISLSNIYSPQCYILALYLPTLSAQSSSDM